MKIFNMKSEIVEGEEDEISSDNEDKKRNLLD